jgi:competence protein ComGC
VLALKQLLVVLLVVSFLLNVSVPFTTVVQRRIRNDNNDSE